MKHLEEHAKAFERFFAKYPISIQHVVKMMFDAIRGGHKVIIFGNGGSAAQAQHFAAELTGHFQQKSCIIPALAISTDIPALTAIANDFGFEYVFVRQCEALTKPGDVVIGISTSGRSPNVLTALKWCKAHGCITVALTGAAGVAIEEAADHIIAVPSENVAVIQELHLICLHIICGLIETSLRPAVARRPVLFIDRDGTLVRDTGYPSHPDDVELLPGVVEGLKAFAEDGFFLVVVTNQSGIARGYFSPKDADLFNEILSDKLRAFGVELSAILMCPHRPGDGCSCRKPGTLLIEQWMQSRNINLTQSWIIGDSASDIDAGRALGIRTAYLNNGTQNGNVVSADLIVRRIDELHAIVRSL